MCFSLGFFLLTHPGNNPGGFFIGAGADCKMAHPFGMIRRSMGISLDDLSRKAGYSASMISRIERQERNASDRTKAKLRLALRRAMTKALTNESLFAA